MRRLCLAAGLVILLTSSATAAPYSQDAGFAKARTTPRKSILIQRHQPNKTDPELYDALKWWNSAAGWDLFLFVGEGSGEVVLYSSEGVCDPNCAVPTGVDGQFHNPPSYPYYRCEVYLEDNPDFYSIAHELGHCLGFGHNFTYQGVMGGRLPKYVRCDEVRALADHDYRGAANC